MPMTAIRPTIRSLARTPLYTLTAILSLALGIGATTAIFSMMDRVLLRQLPVKDPGELAFLYHPGPVQGSSSTSEQGGPAFSYPMFREMQAQQTAFSGLAGSYAVAASAAYNNAASPASALLVSGNYFQVLGVGAAMGRVFDENDDREAGAHPLVVLSHAYWTARLGADSGILNQTMIVNGRGMTIVGVAQKGFIGEKPGSTPELFVPISMKKEMTPDWDGLTDRKDYWVTLFGRMKPGETLEQAATAINVTYQPQLQQDIALLTNRNEDTLQKYRAKKIVLKPGHYGRGQMREQGRKPLQLLLAMTCLVLLIACANVANLQLTRALARSRETAIRLALGASRWQLAGRLLLESCLVAFAGALLGLAVAYGTQRGILAALPARTVGPGVLTATLDGRMLAFALLLALATILIFGLYPALQASRAQLTAALRDQSNQATASRATGLFRKGLVTLQTAISLLLLVSAGLFGKTLLNLSRVDLGVRVDHLMVFSLTPKLNGYDDARVIQLYEQLIERLRAIPGVTSATTSRVPAIAGSSSSGNMTVEGFTPKGDGDSESHFNEVGPDYFRTLGIPLIAGREFSESDRAVTPKVAIVNQAFVRHFIGNRNPIGVGVYRGGGNNVKLDTIIVGIVKDAKYSSMKEAPPPVYYTPYTQTQRQRANYFYVRTVNDPLQAAGAIRAAVAAIDPNLPVVNMRTMQAQIDVNVANERLLSILTGTFAALATLLAAIGLYGVLAFNVARRTREIGIRMALGAGASQVRRLIVREVAVMIGVGVAAGLASALAAGKLIESVLFGTKPSDPWVYTSAAAILCLIALAAAYVPARRATGVDPMIALRCE
jgi:predicted permease